MKELIDTERVYVSEINSILEVGFHKDINSDINTTVC